ncbi:MAG: 6-bladed beta-propeller [Candidatus Aminicenantes bacterium]|nr:6-bladed beta-propeller [Candidatus Aminicenantes bacterium]
MKSKTKVILIILFLSGCIMLNSFGGQEAEWKGKIEYENGVKIIQNPGDPLYGEIKFELEEDLCIGNENDENFLFYRIRDIQVDTDGNIYVLDSGNHRLQVFDKNGKYLRTIGKRGQGPGEFNTPLCLQLDDETGNIFVTDYMSMTIIIFEKEGKYIDKDIHHAELLHDFYVDSDGCIWGKFSLPGIDSRFIKKVTLTGKVENTFAEIPYYVNRIKLSSSKVGNTPYMVGYFFTHGYEYDLFLSQVDNHTFVYGYSKEYKLIAFDNNGDTLFMIKKDEPPKEITKNEKDRIINQNKGDLMKKGYYVPEISIKFPDYMPYFYSIITDNKGRIYVRKNPVSRESNTNHEYDVFNKEGRYIYKIRLNHYPDIIKNGYLYTMVVNEDTGLEQIKRYRIKNWDKIKDGIS